MANVNKAQEVYKSTPGKISQSRPFVPVRGLYVAGVWRPPYWIDQVLNITRVGQSQPATIVNFTEKDENARIGVAKMIAFDTSISRMRVDRYSMITENPRVSVAKMIQFKADLSNMEVTRYSSASYDKYSGNGGSGGQLTGCLRMIQFSANTSEMAVNRVIQVTNVQPPGLPVLNIKSYTTVDATIVNV